MRRCERVADERNRLARVTRRRVSASPFMVLPLERRRWGLTIAQRPQ